MSSLAMAGVAGTMKLPAVTEGVIDEGPDEAVTLASGPPDPSLSTTLTPLMVTEVGSPISMVAAPLPDGSEKREKKVVIYWSKIPVSFFFQSKNCIYHRFIIPHSGFFALLKNVFFVLRKMSYLYQIF